MSDYQLLIHIGYPKAASTWLQYEIFSQAQAGFMSPWGPYQGFNRIPEGSEQFIIKNPFRFSPEAVRQVFEPGLYEAYKRGLIPVLSDELLMSDHANNRYWTKEVADRLHAVFPKARILIFIREQKSMIKSSYGQYLIGAGNVTIRQYIIGSSKSRRLGFGAICRLDHLEYDLPIKYYQNLFGIDNVLVLPMELLKVDQQAVTQKIINFAGAKGIPIQSQPRRNTGIKGVIFVVRRHLNIFCTHPSSSSLGRLAWDIIGKLTKIIEWVTPQFIHNKVEKRLEQTITEHVGNYFRESNQRTSQLIGINLAEWGYDR